MSHPDSSSASGAPFPFPLEISHDELRGCEDGGRTGETETGRWVVRVDDPTKILAGEAKNDCHMCGNSKYRFTPFTSFKHYL